MAIILLFIILLWVGTDLYFYQAVHTLTDSDLVHTFYWGIDVVLMLGLVAILFIRRGSRTPYRLIGWLMGLMLLTFIPRLFSLPVLFFEDATRLFRGFPPRSIAMSWVAIGVAGLLFLIVLFGITRGRHFYRVRRETIFFPDLPEAFDGFTITQITDVHAGSFTDANGVQRGLDLVNAQHSDVILFTGDLVNNKASEMDPWIPAFSKLKAPMGKFSVLGNHDYGHYIPWESEQAQQENLARLKQVHSEIGFRLLLNEGVPLEKNGETISLLGVENWSRGSSHNLGDLTKATTAVPEESFKILMSHDPTHWEGATLGHDQHVHLTFAGHTHGMQFGIELFGIKWSPIQYIYKQWAGLYQRSGRFLYVNRGFGFLGLKGRIGMWPEVAVITLKRTETANAGVQDRQLLVKQKPLPFLSDRKIARLKSNAHTH